MSGSAYGLPEIISSGKVTLRLRNGSTLTRMFNVSGSPNIMCKKEPLSYSDSFVSAYWNYEGPRTEIRSGTGVVPTVVRVIVEAGGPEIVDKLLRYQTGYWALNDFRYIIKNEVMHYILAVDKQKGHETALREVMKVKDEDVRLSAIKFVEAMESGKKEADAAIDANMASFSLPPPPPPHHLRHQQ